MAQTLTCKLAARYLVGRTVVAVEIEKVEYDPHHGGPYHSLRSMTFDDGSKIVFMVGEISADYVVEAVRVPGKRSSVVPV